MKRIIACVGLFILTSLTHAAHLKKPIDRLINKVDPKINMGIEVVDLNTGELLYQRNANRLFIPASNMKLFSDAAALLILGPDYQFKNQLSTDANTLNNGTLNGSLYLHLSGDPSLTHDQLESLLSQLSTMNISRIQGDIVLVSTHGSISPHAPGVDPKDYIYSYGAPIAPVMLDENRLTVTTNPASHAGKPAFIELSAPKKSIQLNNKVTTKPDRKGCGLHYTMNDQNVLTVEGCVGKGQWAVQERLAIRNPLKYAQKIIKKNLAKQRIQLNGDIRLGQAPSSSLLIATSTSKPINQLMADTLKPSDNLYADSLYLHAATTLKGSPADWRQAEPTIKAFLQKQTGIALENAVLIDGSGLSRLDLITPHQTVALLQFLHNRFPLAYEYISALPISGQDGTLLKRLRKPTQQGFVRAKTGSMTGIMSLSGYLYTANAHTLAFAIYINTLPGTKPSISGQYRHLVDTLCDFLLTQKPESSYLAKAFHLHPHARVAYQQHPSAADRQNRHNYKWRQIEASIKKALFNQSVTVLFRNNQLILMDNSANSNAVSEVLRDLSQKYSFSTSVNSAWEPKGAQSIPKLLWINSPKGNAQRTWILRDTLG